jgi:hypothetical protein
MPITTYIIQDLTEETECAWCGFPLYAGDKVYMPTETGEPACSVFCAIRLVTHSNEE